MTRMIIVHDRPDTFGLSAARMSVEARRPGEAAGKGLAIGSARCGDIADRVVHVETVLGTDGAHWRGYRRSRAPSQAAEVWVRR
jgi:hypothetical protein